MSTGIDFGEYGGRYVPETLIPALDELTATWAGLREDDAFHAEARTRSTTRSARR